MVPNLKCEYFKSHHLDMIREVIYINNQQRKTFIRAFLVRAKVAVSLQD